MKKLFGLAAMVVILGACSGGGGGGGDDAPAGGSGDVLQVQVHGLQGSVGLTDGQGHTTTVSADGVHTLARLARGTSFTVAVQSQPTSQVCRVARPSGVIGGATTVVVDCVDGAGLTLGTTSYVADQVVLVDVPASPTTVTATVGGSPVTLVRHGDQLAFLAPDLPAGTHTLSVVADGRTFTRQITITANPLAMAPVDYLTQRTQQELSRIDGLLAGTDLSASERGLLTQVRATLVGEQSRLGALSAEDARRAARLLAANQGLTDELASPARARMVALSRNRRHDVSEDCYRHGVRFTGGMIVVAASTGLAALSAGTGPAGLLGAGVALVGMVEGMTLVRDNLNGVTEHCFSAEELIDVSQWGGTPDAARNASALRVRPLSHEAGHFRHGEASTRDIQVRMRLSDQISASTLAAARSARDAYAQLTVLLADYISLPPAPELDEAAALQREEEDDLPAGELTVEPDTDDIRAAAAQQAGGVALTFRFAQRPYPTQPRTFAYVLRHAQLAVQTQPQTAQLEPPESPARALSFLMYQDGAMRGRLPLAQGTTYAIDEGPAEGTGTVTLEDDTVAEFVYTPPVGYTGSASFTYTMTNEDGTSAPARVNVLVLANCATGAGAGGTSYECHASMPRFLQGYEHSGGNLSSLLFNGLFSVHESSNWTPYREGAIRDWDKSPLAPSGTAVIVSASTGSYDESGNAFTEYRSSGTYDAASDVHVARTSLERSRSVFVLAPDGSRYVPSVVETGYAWKDRMNNTDYYSLQYHTVVVLQGYDLNGRPVHAGQRTECIRTWRINEQDEMELEDFFHVSVTTIHPDGSFTGGQPSESPNCPFPVESFGSIAPAVTPSTMRTDWMTGAVRP